MSFTVGVAWKLYHSKNYGGCAEAWADYCRMMESLRDEALNFVRGLEEVKGRLAERGEPAQGINSDTSTKSGTKQRPGKERKGDASLLADKQAVSFRTAEQYLGISERQRQNLVKDQILTLVGKGQNRRITTYSLRDYLPPENPQRPATTRSDP